MSSRLAGFLRFCMPALLAGFVFVSAAPARADYSVSVNPGTTRGTWEGWGVSLCWWANVFGYRNDLADLVFTTNYVVLNGQNLPGLGMNIARYNAGGCSSTPIGTDTMQASANMPAFKRIQGFWLNWYSSDPTSGSWNWNADANQRAMLLKAKSRGANLFELFSNSPMWWMCYNHNPSGADNGANDNLQSWNYHQHAVYLATIAKYAATNWGIQFDSVEAFNEPSANWWVATGTQEGCHFAAATQAAVLDYLRHELDQYGLGSMSVAASDETSYDAARSTWNSFSSVTQGQVGRVNVHGYQYGGGRRDLLYLAAAGKRLWNSEYGESDGTGMSLASNLNLDFTWLHMTAWCYWQPFDSGGWGLVQSNPGDNWIGTANPKYYVLAHYTRHIRPGMTILDSGDANTVAAYHAAARRLVLVTANYSAAQTITFDLSNYPSATGPVRRWVTVTGTGDKYRVYNDLVISNRVFHCSFSANSIQTFEIANVDLQPPPPTLTLTPRGGTNGWTLSWPGSATNFQPYAASDLRAPADWMRVSNSPWVSNGQFYLTLPSGGAPQQYYRLQAQP